MQVKRRDLLLAFGGAAGIPASLHAPTTTSTVETGVALATRRAASPIDQVALICLARSVLAAAGQSGKPHAVDQ